MLLRLKQQKTRAVKHLEQSRKKNEEKQKKTAKIEKVITKKTRPEAKKVKSPLKVPVSRELSEVGNRLGEFKKLGYDTSSLEKELKILNR